MASQHLKMELTDCSEMSVANYQPTLY